MTRLITYLAIFLTLQINCNGQLLFELTDSVFEVGQITEINITYDFSGNWGPRGECIPLLDSIYVFLRNNNNLRIEIGVHTDYRGDSVANIKVSEKRAKTVEDFLVEMGIDSNRLEHKGYGEYYPIIVDSIIHRNFSFLKIGQKLTEEYIKKLATTEKQEIANMLNRRTEIKIIGKTNHNEQSFFNLTDSVFEAGQVKRIAITYQVSGGCHPTVESESVLDSIFDFLQKNKYLIIEIGAHTDYRGDSITNVKLSEMRALRVKDYLIEKGVEINRIQHKGYGEYDPIIVDSKINEKYPYFPIGQKLTEYYVKKLDKVENRAIANMLNRRTEIKIIKTNRP